VVRVLLILLLLLTGCSFPFLHDNTLVLKDIEIRNDTVWKGKVVIDGSVKVFKGVTLTVLPGADISFLVRDLDRDGLGDGTLIVEGSLRAVGTPSDPIRFRSASESPKPGDWLEIRVDFSKNTYLRYCEISGSAHTIHAHFTKGAMEDCTIRGNIDGSRLGESTFAIRNCLIEENIGKGINFRNATVELTRNIIRYNRNGIFLFESDRKSAIHHNNLYGNEDNFRLGDFFTGDVSLNDNWWGTSNPKEAAKTIHDRKVDPSIGRVFIRPSSSFLKGTGPRDSLALSRAWKYETEGYVDASPCVAGETVIAPSWDGRLYVLDYSGNPLWMKVLGDSIDARPAYDDDTIYCQTWGREVYALDRRDGSLRWQFTYPPSPADDHRQGDLSVMGDLILVPAWNGTLYALEKETGLPVWQYEAGLPLRALPVWDSEFIYLSAGDGTLSVLKREGTFVRKFRFDSPLLTSPLLTPEGPVVLTREGLLTALDPQGKKRWSLDLDEPCHYGAPVFDGRNIYIGTAGGTLWSIEADTGRILWKTSSSSPIYATPLIAGRRLFFGDNGGSFLAINALNGDILASFQIEREIQGAPALSGKRIFFGSRDHGVYALDIIESPESSIP